MTIGTHLWIYYSVLCGKYNFVCIRCMEIGREQMELSKIKCGNVDYCNKESASFNAELPNRVKQSENIYKDDKIE